MKTWAFFSAALLFLGLMIMLFVGGIRVETSKSERVAVSTSTLPEDLDQVPIVPVVTTPATTSELVATTTSSEEQAQQPKPMPNTTSSTATPTTKPAVKPQPKPVAEPTPAPAPLPVVPAGTSRQLKWGIFPGINVSNIEDFEERADANPDYLATFVHWANNEGKLYSFLGEHARDKDRTLILFWEASDYLIGGTVQPDYSYRAILRGDHDEYIADFARQLRDYGGPIILVPFSELNGDWTPWSGTLNGNTPQEAVAAFRYVHGFFDGAPNVKFGLALNSNSVPNTAENALTAYYPGPEYVDYIGLDGFNKDRPWRGFGEIFSPGLNTLSQYGKPILIFSFGSAPGPKKAEWLDYGINTLLPSYPLVEGFVYFNQNKERNWLLWSDEETWQVFYDYIHKN